jgi:hypothetical protein
MVEMSTQTKEDEESAVFTKFMSTQIEDWQENILFAQKDGMKAPIQESETSIHIKTFCNDYVRVTMMIQQEDQLIRFADDMS